MADNNALLAEFDGKYVCLTWPAQNIILDLTAFCERNIAISLHLADMIIARVIDPATVISHKLPIFYLIDSIMKHVGGPYPTLFSRHLVAVFQRAYDEFSPEEKKKLDSLLGTWEERMMLGPDLLVKMRGFINAKKGAVMIPIAAPVAPVMASQDVQSSSASIEAQRHEALRIAANLAATPKFPQQRRQQDQQQHRRQDDEQRQHQQHSGGRGDQQYSGGRGQGPRNPYNAPFDRDNPQNFNRNRQQQGEPYQQQNQGQNQQFQQGRQQQQGQRRQQDFDSQQQQNYKRPRSSSFERERDKRSNRPQGHDRQQQQEPSFREKVDIRGDRGGGGRNERPTPQFLFQRAVDVEMENLLYQMYADMGTEQRLSLGQLQQANPDLFAQMRATAENKVSEGSHESKEGEKVGAVIERKELLRSSAGLGVSAVPAGTDLETSPIEVGPFVNAFVAEAPVVLDLGRAHLLMSQFLDTERQVCPIPIKSEENKSEEIIEINLFKDFEEKIKSNLFIATQYVSSRLKMFLDNADIPPNLPPILFGPLPLEPSKEFMTAHSNNVAATLKPTLKLQKPKFRPEDLDRRADRFTSIISNLYKNQKYQYVEDGMRFKSLTELAKHTDACLTKKEIHRKQELANERVYRQWYCTSNQWITDFSALNQGNTNKNVVTTQSNGHGDGATTEEFVVPADEYFTRCPVSTEVFETVWDEDEGAFMYRNAVKVLVTEKADVKLFKLSKPTDVPDVQYMIVHKLLVMDGWLESGRAETLRGASLRYEAMGKGKETAEALTAAAGDDEDGDDVFVMLELLS